MSKTSILHRYAIALGANRARPDDAVRRLLADDGRLAPGGAVLATSAITHTKPVGPSTRQYANAAAVVETTLPPAEYLDHLKAIERDHGRRRGRRWGARPIDLDIILWSGGIWTSPELGIPHRAFRTRDFVLRPLVSIVPGWRDPVTHHMIRHLHARLTKRSRAPR